VTSVANVQKARHFQAIIGSTVARRSAASVGELIGTILPPDAALIQQAKDAGRMQVQPVQPATVRAASTDFVQPSDVMGVEVDVKALLLSALTVSTYLDKKDEVVTLDVRFGALVDGTGYAARTTLEAKAKNIRVVLENSGHRPLAR
jgi:hypothetical protein